MAVRRLEAQVGPLVRPDRRKRWLDCGGRVFYIRTRDDFQREGMGYLQYWWGIDQSVYADAD